jgi:uncharacterized protein (TIGR00297 family)
MNVSETQSAASPPEKAIPPHRDRLQSHALVAMAIPVLVYLAWQAVQYTSKTGHGGEIYLEVTLAVSFFFALATCGMGAATPAAAACGGLICFDLTILSGRPDGGSIFHSGLSPLILLFVLTQAATRFCRRRKPPADSAEEKHGRNAAQVIANLGMAVFASAMYYHWFHRSPHLQMGPMILAVLEVPMLAALAEATADTVSSEVGQAIGGTPFLLTTFRPVAPGTDGAISAAGTLTGIGAAAVVAITAIPALGMEPQDCVKVLIAATGGLFFDSLLGATVERRGWIGNDLVNFASTLFAVAIAVWLIPTCFA